MGAAIVRMFLQEGAKVILTDRSADGVADVGEGFREAFGDSVMAMRHDVSVAEDWDTVIAAGTERFGPVTVLVNNAAILSPHTYDKVSYDVWTQLMTVNAWGPFMGMQRVIPMMKSAGGGSIVNIASIAAVNSAGGFSAYTASKGAVLAYSRSAAIELAPFKIRVNVVNPGATHTQMVDLAYPDEASMKQAYSAQPLGTMGTPEDIAHLVLYLAGDESKFTTGVDILVDGGAAADGSNMRTVLER